MVPKLSLRQRNRLEAMRLVQTTAMGMFAVDGFHGITIEAIAGACGVSASTIYRHFGTKENVVLWDEREAVINAELGKRLGRQPSISAFRDAVVVGFAERDDRDLFVRRLQLIYSEPSIWAAAAQQDRLDRSELAAGIAAAAGRKRPTVHDEAVAAICLSTLDVALEHWQRHSGRTPLAAVLDQSIEAAIDLSGRRNPRQPLRCRS